METDFFSHPPEHIRSLRVVTNPALILIEQVSCQKHILSNLLDMQAADFFGDQELAIGIMPLKPCGFAYCNVFNV